MTDHDVSEYRGQQFRVEARHDGRTWTGHYRLLGVDAQLARRAAAAGRHHWTPIDPGWSSRPEAERNALQAAHAAIDALSWHADLPPV